MRLIVVVMRYSGANFGGLSLYVNYVFVFVDLVVCVDCVACYGIVFTVDCLVWFKCLVGGVGFVYVLLLGL